MKVGDIIKNKKIIIISAIIIALIIIAFIIINIDFGTGKENNIPPEKTIEQLTMEAREFCSQNGGEVQGRFDNESNQYEVCFFEGNKECDIFEMKNGDCPIGGRQMVFSGPRDYCVSVGGEYLPKEDALIEDLFITGDCVLDNGEVLNALELFRSR